MKSLLFTAILSLRKRSELIKFAILLQVRLTHAQTFFRGVANKLLQICSCAICRQIVFALLLHAVIVTSLMTFYKTCHMVDSRNIGQTNHIWWVYCRRKLSSGNLLYLIGFFWAQYGKILSRDFNIGRDRRSCLILKSRLNILSYWAKMNPIGVLLYRTKQFYNKNCQ
jgi:hypothetical protein